MEYSKARGAIGLAYRAGKALMGMEVCARAMKQGKGVLALLDPSASENTRQEMERLCNTWNVPWIRLPQAGMAEEATGRANGRIIVITDRGFAALIKSNLD